MGRLATLLLLSTLLLSCGARGPRDDQGDPRDVRAVRAAFTEFAQAIDAGDFVRACALYTPRAKRSIVDGARALGVTTGDCAVAFRPIARRLGEQHHQLRGVVVDGDRATARNPGSHSDRLVAFRRVDGRWMVDVAR